MGSTWMAAFAKRGLLLPLNDVFDVNNFPKGILASCRIDGDDELYGKPWFADTRLVYYWKRYFPKGDASFSTFESFESSVSAIRGVKPFAMAAGISWNLMHTLAPWVWAEGGVFVKPTILPGFYHAPWDEQGFKNAVVFLHGLAGKNLLDLPQDNAVDVESKFLDGKYASVLSISNLTGLPGNWQDKIGVAMLPGGKAGRFPFLGGSHLTATKFSKEKFKEGVELINFLTSAENEIKYARATGFFPPNRVAMERYMNEHPELTVFKNAFELGKFYPSIPEWGEIFENEITRTYLFNLWSDIALGKPIESVLATLADISNQINKRLIHRAITKYSIPAVLFFLVLMFILAVAFLRWRRKETYFLDQLDGLTGQIRYLEGQKTVLEGQVALLEKYGDVQIDEINRSKEKLTELELQIEGLTDKFENIHTKHCDLLNSPRFYIRNNGNIIINEERELQFENARQARRLIEYIVRHSNHEQLQIHCLKGFILFDWNDIRGNSNPKRLFDTVVSKTNLPLKKAGLPVLLQSSGRDSWMWRVAWSAKLFEQNSDIFLARRHITVARENVYNKNVESGINEILAALRLDPKCIEALSLLQELGEKKSDINPSKLITIKNLERISGQMFEKSLNQMLMGLKSAIRHIDNLRKANLTEYATRLENEIVMIEAEIETEKNIIRSLFTNENEQPLYLKGINKQLSDIYSNIVILKRNGCKTCDIWAQITQDRSFLSLLSVPQMQSLVHNFYDHTTREVEDPRLVKLAMILMLNGKDCLNELENEMDGIRFFKTIEKNIRLQFRYLEQEIGRLNSEDL